MITDLDPADTRTTTFAYVTNDSDTTYLVDRARRIWVVEGLENGTPIRRDTRFFYDSDLTGLAAPTKGLLTRQIAVENTGAGTGPITTFDHDDYGNLESTSDPNTNAAAVGEPGNTTTITYDAVYHAFPEQVTNSLGHRKRFAYTSSTQCPANGHASYPAGGGRVHLETGPNDADNTGSIRCYDAFGRIRFQLASGGLARSTFTYGDVYSPTTPIFVRRDDLATTAGGVRSTYTYFDTLGRVLQTTTTGPVSGGGTIAHSRVYDGLGRLRVENAPSYAGQSGPSTTYGYDPLDRVNRIEGSGGGRVTTLSHVKGLVTTTDATNHIVKRRSDTFGNVVSVVENDGTGELTTSFEYDAASQLRTVTDARNFVTSIGYNTLGRKITMTDPDVGTIGYSYDANGNRLREIPFATPQIVWTYDPLGRSLTRLGGAADEVTWTYDTALIGKGLLATRTDGAGTFTAVEYDLLGRPTRDRQTINGSGLSFTTTFDPLGQVASRRFPTNGGLTIFYGHDSAGYLTSISSSTSFATSIRQDALGRLTSWTAGNGIVTTNTYDDDTGRLERVSVERGIEKLTRLQYGYYTNDQIQSVTDQSDVPYPGQSFSYDGMNRLTVATGPYGSNFASQTLRYAYDAIGNLTCKDASVVSPSCIPGTSGTVMAYPTEQSFASHPVHAPATVNGLIVSYDPNGNLLGWGSRAYTYDGMSDLLSVSNGGTVQATYGYGASGARTSAVDETTVRRATRHFVRDDFEWEITREFARIHVALGGRVIASQTALLPQSAPAAAPLGAPFDRGVALAIAITPPALAALLVAIQLARLRRRRDPLREPALAGFVVVALCVSIGAPVWALPPLPLDANGKPIPNGDLNADGRIDAADVYLAQQIASAQRTALADEVDRGDVAPLDQAPKTPHAVADGDVVLLLRALREADVDGDGVANEQEIALGASPFRVDSDRDGLSDTDEVGTWGSDPSRPDSDGDGLDDSDEVGQHADPLDVDTDGDGYIDGQDGLVRTGVVWRHQDHLGSTALVTRTDGQVIQRAMYKPYGAMQSASGADYAKRLGFYFTGQRFEAAIGLYDYGARFYDPTIGRFLQADTIVPNPSNPQTLNRYAYVENNPLMRIDPTGRFSIGFGVGFGTVSYSSDSGSGIDWDWGPSLGFEVSSGSYGNGWGFSAMTGWDNGFSLDLSGWADSNYVGVGYGFGQAYAATQFGSFGGAMVLGQRALRAEVALGHSLGAFDLSAVAGISGRLTVNKALRPDDEHAAYEPKGSHIELNRTVSRLGFGKLRAALGHELFHVADDTEELNMLLYEKEAELGGPQYKVWNSKFTEQSEYGFRGLALELRAQVYEANTNRYRGASPDLGTSHYLQQYGDPIDALGLRNWVLGAPR
jgi:RHS repeat-associated protein